MRHLLLSFFVFPVFYSIATAEEPTPIPSQEKTPPPSQISVQATTPSVFSSFTGKVIANKVRLRQKPSLESTIIQQLNKHDVLLVVGEEGDFWKVAPPMDFKAYVFKSYIIDHVVEANRVNIRLKPELESPVIGQLQNGEKVQDNTYGPNPKWLEISPTETLAFYVAKEFLTNVGGPELVSHLQKKKIEGKKILNTAYFLTQNECKKSYEEMTPQEATRLFDTVVKEFSDFPEYVQQAKEGLSLLQDNLLQKKVAQLEENKKTAKVTALTEEPKIPSIKMDWKSAEHSLFVTWNSFHPEKTNEDFYKEQTANAISFTGTIEPYDVSVKNKPGDYLLKKDGLPIAYLYSTNVDLSQHVGKTISLSVSSRPNHNFAFPAYFVNAVEEDKN